MRPSILLGGYYGAGNVGDEAILAAILQDLQERMPAPDVTVISWDPGQTRRTHQVQAVHWREMDKIVDSSRNCDLILVGGGGLFQDHWGLEPETYLRWNHGGITTYGSLPLLAEWAGVPCMMYGVGIGPLSSDLAREQTRLAAERCQGVCVRDTLSDHVLEEIGYPKDNHSGMGVKVTADPAFSLPTSVEDEERAVQVLEEHGISGPGSMVAVNLRYWDQPHPPQAWLPGIAEGLNGFMDAHPVVQVVLIPFQHTGESAYTDDLSLCRQLSRILPEEERVHLLDAVPSPGTCQALLGLCDLVLGMRLHSLIMGINRGIPVVGLPYDPKVTALLDEVGLDAYCLPTYAPDPDTLQDMLEGAWQNRKQIKERLNEISSRMTGRAKENASQAVDVLEAPFQPERPGWIRRLGQAWIKLRYQVDRYLKA